MHQFNRSNKPSQHPLRQAVAWLTSQLFHVTAFESTRFADKSTMIHAARYCAKRHNSRWCSGAKGRRHAALINYATTLARVSLSLLQALQTRTLLQVHELGLPWSRTDRFMPEASPITSMEPQISRPDCFVGFDGVYELHHTCKSLLLLCVARGPVM